MLSFDLAIGVPLNVIQQYETEHGKTSSFFHWLTDNFQNDMFWKETADYREWSTTRPFITVPAGKGALQRFDVASRSALRRNIDIRFGAKSPFIVSGIPGTVGSGTRCFWQELAPMLNQHREFKVWPFEGNLDHLANQTKVIIGENYPALSYTAVCADALPHPQLLLHKTRREVRAGALAHLLKLDWIRNSSITLPDLSFCLISEDHFDALMAALGQLRLVESGLGLSDEAQCDSLSEGGILGSHAISDAKRIIGHDLRPAIASSNPVCTVV